MRIPHQFRKFGILGTIGKNCLQSFVSVLTGCMLLCSCSSNKLSVPCVSYQSVRPVNYKTKDFPSDAKIMVIYGITSNGQLIVGVVNLTNEIMTIDQTKSFFVNSDGKSISYYDPTVRTTTTTNVSSGTQGASVNLGAIGGALGIGGPLGALLNGINVGESETQGFSTSNTEYFADLPQISLAPKSQGLMTKDFEIKGLGIEALTANSRTMTDLLPTTSPCKFSVCISYSIDNGESYEKIVTDMYLNSQIIMPVTSKGHVNDALRNIYSAKSDALSEPWKLIYINNNIPTSLGIYDNYTQGLIYDFQ